MNILYKVGLGSVIGCLGIATLTRLLNVEVEMWPLGELLINYQGGFVRRGLLGQIFVATENPAYFATLLQKIVIGAFFLGAALAVFIWPKWNVATVFVFTVCVAPGGLYDMALGIDYSNEPSETFDFLGRKEIWFYVALLCGIGISGWKTYYSTGVVAFNAAISVVMILIHELFAVYFVPIFVLLYLARWRPGSIASLLPTLIYALPVLVTIVLIYVNPGDSETVSQIKASYVGTDAEGIEGGINALGWTFAESNNLSLAMHAQGSVATWVFYLVISLFMCNIMLSTFATNLQSYLLGLLALSWFIIATFILAYSGWDWGRWISIVSVGFPLTTALIFVANNGNEGGALFGFRLDRGTASRINLDAVKRAVFYISVVTLMIFIGYLTRMPLCCPQGPSLPMSFLGI